MSSKEFLDIYSLTQERDKKIQNRLNLFDEILKKCHKKIKQAADSMNAKCVFVIPEYVIGMPLYNSEMCKVFLVNTLREEKFDVKFFFPNILFISWEKVLPPKQQLMLPPQLHQPQISSNPYIVPPHTNLLLPNKSLFIDNTMNPQKSHIQFINNEPELTSLKKQNNSQLKYVKTGKLFD
jgi:hypothetical protein